MEKQQGQKMEKKAESDQEHKKAESLEGLPVEDSPYLQYENLEDYKQKGYGTQGHLQPKPGHGAGATDAPTLSGSSVPLESDVSTIDAITSRHDLGTR
ncbi:hypothetical protein P3X46_012572 [Hevea brasiliensis]|uniref:Late embryogenesis abundant protein, LEA-18 n=1 Tax=Hevea brasiliensis TaxID=3981 RepID=A0ABQ9MB12_HEVBR|nr:uncharacterized protein LOC110646242 [Hevea brasiliensis]KAJ9177341.1 hypothetical protein P3X46_012572 [Hevea brasiliensis]